jgi:ATP-dependent exoDNAse (exonuclease V) alpha subunit
MFIVSKSKVGVSLEYLANAEDEHIAIDFDFNTNISDPELKKILGDISSDLNVSDEKLKNFASYMEQESPHYKAKMRGGLALAWNINEYDRQTYTDLMSNKLPDGIKLPDGVKIKKNGNIITTKENGQSGMDTLSNGPKSVAIEFARGPKDKQDKIHRAVDKTTEQIFEQIATQMKPSCRESKYQDFIPSETKLMVVSFTHYENRGYEENGVRRLEPNLHFHNSVMNFAEFTVYKHDEDGNRIKDDSGQFITENKMLAIDPDDVFKKQLENSAMFDTLLNSNLQKEGFKTEPADENGHPTFRIAGYTREMEESLSRRSQEIYKFVEEQKKAGILYSSDTEAEAEYMKIYRQNTAQTKEIKNAGEILNNIKETVDLNISKNDQINIDRVQETGIQKNNPPDFYKIMKSQFFETDGVVDDTKLKTAIIQEVRFLKTFDSIKQLEQAVDSTLQNLLSKSMGVNRLIKMEDGRYTRLDIALNEKALQNNVEKLKDYDKPLSDKKLNGNRNYLSKWYKDNSKGKNSFKKKFTINDGQMNACKSIISENVLTMIIGDAGTGKTTSVIRFANEFYQSQKRTVYGLSVGTGTSRDLKEGNIDGKNCLNTKEFIKKAFVFDEVKKVLTNELNIKFLKENLNSVLIFDEAGMCGSEDMKKITDFVQKAKDMGGDTKLILVGDHKQLSAVSYGNSFLNIQKQLNPNQIARLEQNTRQVKEIPKAIAEGYRDKDINKVFSVLTENNLLITAEKQEDVMKELVKDYLADINNSKLIVCGINAEIDQINKMVRVGIIQQEKDKLALDKNYKSQLDYKHDVSITVCRKSGIQNVEKKKDFCKGEEILFLKNSDGKQKKAGFDVSNSDRGIIKNIKKLGSDNYLMTVQIKDREVQFETKNYNNFDYSRAVSTHKSQGKTVDNTYHYGNANQARYENSYVNGSRHREQYKLYLQADQVEKFKQNAVKEAIKETTLNDSYCKNAVEEYVFESVKKDRNIQKPMPVYKQKQTLKDEQLENAKKFAEEKSNQSKLIAEQKYAVEQERISKIEAIRMEKEKLELAQKQANEELAKQEKLKVQAEKIAMNERIKEFDLINDSGKYRKEPETLKEKLEKRFFTTYRKDVAKSNLLQLDCREFIDNKVKQEILLNVEKVYNEDLIKSKNINKLPNKSVYREAVEMIYETKDFVNDRIDSGYVNKAIEFISNSKLDLYSATKEQLVDKQFVLNAVAKDGNNLKYADKFKDDYDVILKAVQNNQDSYKYASEDINLPVSLSMNRNKCDLVNALKELSIQQKLANDIASQFKQNQSERAIRKGCRPK